MQRYVHLSLILFTFACMMLSGCSFNPFVSNNHLTGDPTATAIGAGAGVGTVALFRGSPPALVAGGLIGGGLGYYASSLRFASKGIIHHGGDVYRIGEVVGIYIPTDNLFVVNTADFTFEATAILDSAANVLKRYPQNNILISGNTSGFSQARWEKRLSLRRAQRVAAYLWNAGINNFSDSDGGDMAGMRKLNYVGYGDYMPISSNLTNKGIRENSRIQITSYPDTCNMHLDKRHVAMYNIGGMSDKPVNSAPNLRCNGDPNCFDGEG